MKIYYSLPAMLDSASHIFNSTATQLRTRFENVKCSKWQGGSYNPNLLDNCDIFVFTTPNNKFQFYIDDLPSGVKKELKRAIQLKKEIFLIYKTADDTINFYKISINGQLYKIFISGIAGTSSYIYNYIDDNEGKTDENSYEKFVELHTIDTRKENLEEEFRRHVYTYPILKQDDFEIKSKKDKRVLL